MFQLGQLAFSIVLYRYSKEKGDTSFSFSFFATACKFLNSIFVFFYPLSVRIIVTNSNDRFSNSDFSDSMVSRPVSCSLAMKSNHFSQYNDASPTNNSKRAKGIAYFLLVLPADFLFERSLVFFGLLSTSPSIPTSLPRHCPVPLATREYSSSPPPSGLSSPHVSHCAVLFPRRSSTSSVLLVDSS